tara:strand:- start:244 stop:414 length:171 start_codon:yes stop_codon:yes gene_type:complete
MSNVRKYAAHNVHLLYPLEYLGIFVATFTLNWSQNPLHVIPIPRNYFLAFNTFTII